MSDEAIFVDTWGWMALGHRQDPRHPEVKRLHQQLRNQHGAIYTSDDVLDEAITVVFRREVFAEAVRFADGLFAAATLGHLIIERVTSDRFSAAWRLRQRLQDKPRISFTDLPSMVIMQACGISRVLTEDEHFVQVGLGFSKLP